MLRCFVSLFFLFARCEVPYIYNHGDSEIKLFLSFDCPFCEIAVKNLMLFLQTKPSVKVRLYYYIFNAQDQEKAMLMFAAGQELQLIQELYFNFLHLNRFKLKRYLKDKALLLSEMKQNKKQYEKNTLYSANEFIKCHVQGSPTFIIQGSVVEGVIKDFEKFLK